MNFYKRYIGDYARDTADLSLAEHGAYNLLLDHHYATEQPLPSDAHALYRICKAFSKGEQKAVDSVVARFFDPDPSGKLVNKRAQIEMEKRTHQVAVNREIGNRGGRPKRTEQRTESVTEPKTDSVLFLKPIDNPSHSHSQNQIKTQEQSTRRGARLPSGFIPPEAWFAFCREERPDLSPEETYNRFHDYWTGIPGQKGCKLDWEATWRNWVRAERRNAGRGAA